MSSQVVARKAVALVAAAFCTLSACTDAGTETGTPSTAATEAAVRAVMVPYEARLKARIVSFVSEDGRIGVYLKPEPAWDVDTYVEALPVQAAAARAILAAVPDAQSADVCADGPWLPHKGDTAYSTATKVLLFRERLSRVPADLSTPALVVRAALRDKSLDIYVDPKIQLESATWRVVRKAGQ